MRPNELETMGAALYWAEGTKMRVDKRGWKQYHVVFTNTDPRMIKAFLKFLRSLKEVNENRIKIQLHLYPEHDTDEEIDFWSNVTKIPQIQFEKIIYAKGAGKRKNSKHGICAVRYYNKSVHLKIEQLIDSLPK